jgi:hypothetical protein
MTRRSSRSGEPARPRGDLARPFTLIEYGDYECRFCGAASTATDVLHQRPALRPVSIIAAIRTALVLPPPGRVYHR